MKRPSRSYESASKCRGAWLKDVLNKIIVKEERKKKLPHMEKEFGKQNTGKKQNPK